MHIHALYNKFILKFYHTLYFIFESGFTFQKLTERQESYKHKVHYLLTEAINNY